MLALRRDHLALIAYLSADGQHLLGDGMPRTPAAGMLILLDTASMSTHLLSLHEASLILNLSGSQNQDQL